MLSMLEYISTAVMSNERNDPKAATWVYFDEIYLLLRDSFERQFPVHKLEALQKVQRLRHRHHAKYAGLPYQ